MRTGNEQVQAGGGAVRTELGELVKQAMPIAAAQGGLALMGFVDTAVAGRAGAEVLGAVGLGNALFFAVSAFGIGLMAGMDPLMSQAFGAGQPGRARGLIREGSYLAWLAAIALGIPVCLVALLLGSFDFEPGVARGAAEYLLYRSPSLIPVFLFLTYRSYLQAIGRTGALVTATVVANLANLGLDILLVLGGSVLPEWCGVLREIPAMGASGAAIATTLCSVLNAGTLWLAIRRVPGAETPPSKKPNWKDIRLAATVGLPIGLHIAAEVGVFALAGVLAARFGSTSMAAHQIALTFGSLTFCLALGLGNAGSVRVGWAVGAGDSESARRRGFVALAGGVAFMSCSALVFFIAPNLLARMMTDDPAVLEAVIPLMAIAAAFQIFDGLQGIGAGVLRGVGDTRFTFLANLGGHYFVGLPVSLLLGHLLGWGITGIWWGLCVGLIVVAVALVWRFHALSSRPVQALEQQLSA